MGDIMVVLWVEGSILCSLLIRKSVVKDQSVARFSKHCWKNSHILLVLAYLRACGLQNFY